MVIRPSIRADLESITQIYNDILLHSTAIYRDVPFTLEDRTEWWESQRSRGYPVLVAEVEGAIVGFATLSDFRTWPGYRFTVEGTIHLAKEARRKGTGTALLQELIASARSLGKRMLIAGVDSDNAASLQFLEKNGFVRAAHLREVGYKFGRFLDLVLLQYRLS